MKSLFSVIGALVLVLALFFIAPLLGAIFGAFSGWVVGLFFSGTILGICAQLGIHGFAMWQIGTFLGFVGGFIKSVQTNSK